MKATQDTSRKTQEDPLYQMTQHPTYNGYRISALPEMYEALADAVEKYGKPGGPWNVPGEPGSWIEKAKAALRKARGEE